MPENGTGEDELAEEVKRLRARLAELEHDRDGKACSDVAEPQGGENQLSQSEKRFRRILENRFDAAYSRDLEVDAYEYMSPGFEDLTGFPAESLQRMPIADYLARIHPDDLGRAREIVEMSAAADKNPNYIEYRFLHRDGAYRWFGDLFSVVKGDDGKAKFRYGSVRDITESKRTEQALVESEHKYRELFESMAQGVFYQSSEGRLVDCNLAALEMFGLSRDQFLGRTSMHPDWRVVTVEGTDLPGEEHPSMVALKTGNPVLNFPLAVFNPRRQSLVWLSVNAIPRFRPGDDRPHQVFVTLHDITDRKLAEEALRRSESQLLTALELGRMGHWELDLASRFFTFNDSFYSIFRTTAAAMNGYTMALEEYSRRFVHPDDAHRVAEETEKAIRSEDPDLSTYLEHRMLYADGEVGYLAVRYVVVRDKDGRPVKTLGVNQDITERRRMEDELQTAQRLESLGLLAGGIAHDFNNLLGGLFGYMDLAQEELDTGHPARTYLQHGLAAMGRARDLTQQLLTFSKGGAPRTAVTELAPILEESRTLALSGSSTVCNIQLDEPLDHVKADPNQLTQVFNNVLLNARQAMPRGGVVAIAGRNLFIGEGQVPELQAGRYVLVEVRDEGVGIPDSLIHKVFDPFFTTKETGSGLGLATCYSIIRKHGGTVTLGSRLNEGTTVRIYLPASGEREHRDAASDSCPNSLRGRVLVMDDEEFMRDIAGRMLERLGFEVFTARSGEEAFEIFSRQLKGGEPFDFVLLDLTMAGGVGGEVIMSRILELDPEVLGVVASGYADSPVLARPEKHGFVGILKKPFRRGDLARVFGEVCMIRNRRQSR